MSSQFDLWVAGCKINNTIVYMLDGCGDTGLYQTKTQYMVKNFCHYSTPVYHVWFKGKCLVSTTNLKDAQAVWSDEGEG